MLTWAIVFLCVSLIAAGFGFTGITFAAAGVAKIVFFFFLVPSVLPLILGVRRRPGA